MVDDFWERGWVVFPPEPSTTTWAAHALQDAKRALEDPKLSHQYQCEHTWFVGLDALNNDAEGRIGNSAPLSGRGVDFVKDHFGKWPALHRAQVSGIFPGYPKPRTGETDAGFRYRLHRDAAHVDGVLGLGVPKRRFVKEPHAFILGIPLTDPDSTAAPLVVWEGSHKIMRRSFGRRFQKLSSDRLDEVDVTETYQEARQQVFEACSRHIVTGPAGSLILVHRLALHGVAPWEASARAAPEGRLIAYFRPPMPGGVQAWTGMD